MEGMKGFRGCGCAWVPTGLTNTTLEIAIWKPIENKLISGRNISGALL
jgi:hypothetical protein